MDRTVSLLQETFNKICNRSYLYEWEEAHITLKLMRALRDLFESRTIHFDIWSKMVQWQSFKNRDKQETSSGDIALLVHIQSSSGETLKGVVCIEAKRSFNNDNFASMDQQQLDRIYSNLPHAHLLFYTLKPQLCPLKFPRSGSWKSHMSVTPIGIAKELNKQVKIEDNWTLLQTSFPFEQFITSSVFWGLDLDFREEVYRDIKLGTNKVFDPTYLGVVNVFYDGQQPAEVELSEIWQEITE